MKKFRIKYVYITTPNRPDLSILPDVMRLMESMGPPIIRAVPSLGDRVDHWIALEGSHRVVAAKKLGMAIIIRPMKPNQRIRHDVTNVYPKRTTVKKVMHGLNECGQCVKYRVAALILP
jgi:hypothetical protein